MQSVDTTSTARLNGNAASPLIVAGVTTAPSEMPTSTEIARDNATGTVTGRPASAATATASSEPMTRPAGKPSHPNTMPPTAAIDSVSAVRNSTSLAGVAGGDIGAINAAPPSCRQTARPQGDKEGQIRRSAVQ